MCRCNRYCKTAINDKMLCTVQLSQYCSFIGRADLNIHTADTAVLDKSKVMYTRIY